MQTICDKWVYTDIKRLYGVYEKVVDVSGGGAKGVLDFGKVEGILEQVKNDDYYPEIEDKLTYLFFSLNKYHCFEDGNKRIALACCMDFLLINGYVFLVSRFAREMENISIHVASGKVDRKLLYKIIQSLIYEDEYSEELKLEIVQAII
ncbi:MAG: Fic family protein [Clostridium sp.]|uniref:type II toxin-antitoxin system death-on-curing family toxin n=1 Tax=Clostridium TaxID=1485 RepID=UPI00033F7901|nr:MULTISPECIES: Fic family protein [unclassified Clostridium]MBS5126413.1 Fic family protein [Clostridium sp.]CDB74138.1 death-on-curing family protein [Clostridium sp. CAG:265]